MMRVPVAFVFATAITLVGSSSRAADVATAPYVDLCRGMNVDFSADPASLPRDLTFRVQSRLAEVKPEAIKFTLTGGAETHEIRVAPDGTFTLPVSKSLFEADAQLFSNQPKGTLTLAAKPLVGFEDIRVPLAAHIREGRIDYMTLCQACIERRQKVAQELTQRGNAVNNGPQVGEGEGQWILVLRAGDNEASAKAVVVSDGKREEGGPLRSGLQKLFGPQSPLQKVEAGVFVILYSESLREQNPVISLSPDSSWFGEIGFVPKKPK